MKKKHNHTDRLDYVTEPEEDSFVTARCLMTDEKGEEEEAVVSVGLADQKEVCIPETYEAFMERLKEDVRALGYQDEDLEIHKTDNGTEVMDIHAHVNGGIVRFRAYPCELFANALREGYEDAVKSILDQIRDTEKNIGRISLSSSRLSGSYEELRDRLIIRPLNFTRYAMKLMNGIYQRHGDVALAVYLILADQGGMLMTRMIERREVEEWKMTDQTEEIFTEALNRTAQRYPATVLSETYQYGIDLLRGDYRSEDIITSRVGIQLSSSIGTNGAVALFYPGVSVKLAELMHGKFAAVFLNTTDVMILKPDSPYLEGYMQFAGQENAFGEMLSGRKYLFDKEGKLMNA